MIRISSESVKTCPNCAETIQAKAIYCRYCQRGLTKTEFKKCPYCAEMIKKTANRCRFCKIDLFGAGDPAGARPPADAPVPRIPINPSRSAAVVLPLPTPDEEK